MNKEKLKAALHQLAQDSINDAETEFKDIGEVWDEIFAHAAEAQAAVIDATPKEPVASTEPEQDAAAVDPNAVTATADTTEPVAGTDV